MAPGAEDIRSVGGIQLKWDPKDLEIKTRSVEMALQPLVMKVRDQTLTCLLKGPIN